MPTAVTWGPMVLTMWRVLVKVPTVVKQVFLTVALATTALAAEMGSFVLFSMVTALGVASFAALWWPLGQKRKGRAAAEDDDTHFSEEIVAPPIGRAVRRVRAIGIIPAGPRPLRYRAARPGRHDAPFFRAWWEA